ncbi:MAG: type I secretion C-terminal target domain-containing protein, partial [Methylococcaceae bacterium]
MATTTSTVTGVLIDRLGSTEGDIISGTSGNDTITGSSFDDSIYGGEGNDIITGGDGNDYFRITYNAGSDSIVGGAGNDKFVIRDNDWQFAANNTHTLTGGTGNDIYAISSENKSAVIITDFTAGVSGDVLDVVSLLTNSVNLIANPFLSSNRYFRLIQDTVTPANALFQWDQDGETGTQYAWKTVVTLQNTTAANFVAANFAPQIPT